MLYRKKVREGFININLTTKEYHKRTFNDKRNELFEETRWSLERFQETGDNEKWEPYKVYRQALRDMPAQTGFKMASPKFPLSPNEV